MAAAGRLRADLQRDLRGRPRGGRPRAGRLRRDGAARPERPDELAPVDLAAHVPAGGEADAASATSTPGRTTRTTAARARRRRRGNLGPRAVGLGNIDTLISEVTRLYGRKPLWITEYGYQTKPPDELFGVSWKKQAEYLRQAYEIARANPRIDLFTWFLLKDSPTLERLAIGPDHRRRPQEARVRRFAALRADSL